MYIKYIYNFLKPLDMTSFFQSSPLNPKHFEISGGLNWGVSLIIIIIIIF